MNKAIVTGGAGFIGSHLVKKLHNLNYKIFILDDLSGGFEKNIPLSDNIFFEKIDIRSDLSYIFNFFKPDYIFHLAAKGSIPFSIKNPILSNDININGTLNLLDLSVKFKIKRFIFSSSSSIYGGNSGKPSSELDHPIAFSPYALQKLTCEGYCKLYSNYGIDTCSLRYFNVFGKNQNSNSEYSAVIPSFLRHKKEGTTPTIYGDGNQKRDFCHVDNVVLANIAAAMRISPFKGEIFNIGSGNNISINEVANYFNFKNIIYKEKRDGDIQNSLADISRAQALLGYSIVTDFKNGIKDLL